MYLHETLKTLTDAQVALLYDVAPAEVDGLRELALEEYREQTVKNAQRVVGLLEPRAGGRQHHWTAEEKALALSNLPAREVAERLGIRVRTLYSLRARLRDPASMSKRKQRMNDETVGAEHHGERWSEEEDQLVYEFAGSIGELAKILGRTYFAVSDRRTKLRRDTLSEEEETR